MWSKLNEKLYKLLKSKSSDESLANNQDALELVDLAIKDLEISIQKSKPSLNKAKQHHQEISRQLKQHITESEALYTKATEATQNGNDWEAKSFLSQKRNIDKQVAAFQQLHTEIQTTVQKLDAQLKKMKMKLETTKAKKVVLAAQLESAKSQSEINKALADLEDNSGWEDIEMEITKAEVTTELEGESLDEQIEALTMEDTISQDLSALQADIDQKETQKKAEEEAKKFKKINQLFAQQLAQETALTKEKAEAEKEKRKKMLEDFKESTPAPKNDKERLLEEFMNTASESTEIPTSQEETSVISEEQQRKIDAFLKDEPKETKDDKQKKIDDFFNTDS